METAGRAPRRRRVCAIYFRMATRLQTLSEAVGDQVGGDVGEMGRRYTDPGALVAHWTNCRGGDRSRLGCSLGELLWRLAGCSTSPRSPRASDAVRHLDLLTGRERDGLTRIRLIARQAGCDERDLEAALVRLGLAHRRTTECPGGRHCVLLESAPTGGSTPK